MDFFWTDLLVCDVLGANKTVYHRRVKLPASRNLKHKWKQSNQLILCFLWSMKWMCIIWQQLDWSDELVSDLLDVDQLTDVHVVVTVANVRPHCLHHLSDHGDDDVPPGQRQRLAVEQLLQQRHHVAVIGRAEQKAGGQMRRLNQLLPWRNLKHFLFVSSWNHVIQSAMHNETQQFTMLEVFYILLYCVSANISKCVLLNEDKCNFNLNKNINMKINQQFW